MEKVCPCPSDSSLWKGSDFRLSINFCNRTHLVDLVRNGLRNLHGFFGRLQAVHCAFGNSLHLRFHRPCRVGLAFRELHNSGGLFRAFLCKREHVLHPFCNIFCKKCSMINRFDGRLNQIGSVFLRLPRILSRDFSPRRPQLQSPCLPLRLLPPPQRRSGPGYLSEKQYPQWS